MVKINQVIIKNNLTLLESVFLKFIVFSDYFVIFSCVIKYNKGDALFMKKVLLALSVLCGMLLVSNFEGAKADSITVADESVEVSNSNELLNVNATNQAWRWWHTTLPIDYVGQTKYQRIYKHSALGQSTCYDGYLGARNVGGGKFIYEGYLYICGGNKPIPTKAPVKVDTSSAKLETNYTDEQGVA